MTDGGYLSNMPAGFEERMERRLRANIVDRALTVSQLNQIVETLPADLGTKLKSFASEYSTRFRGHEEMGEVGSSLNQYAQVAAESAAEIVNHALKQWPLPDTLKEITDCLTDDKLLEPFEQSLREKKVPEQCRRLFVDEFKDVLSKTRTAMGQADFLKSPAMGGRS